MKIKYKILNENEVIITRDMLTKILSYIKYLKEEKKKHD